MATISFDNPKIYYEDFSVIESFQLDIEEGEIVTLFGPSGCGKSTLMKALINQIQPRERTTITINGRPASEYHKPIAYTSQNNELLPWLSVYKNIELWWKDSKHQNTQIIDEILDLLDLSEAKERLPQELSGGMARRAVLARCLATRSEIMCLDEVLVGIQRSFRRSLMVNTRDFLIKNKITTLIISHDHEEAVFMSDRIVLLTPSPTIISKPPIQVKETLGTYRNLTTFNSTEFTRLSTEIFV